MTSDASATPPAAAGAAVRSWSKAHECFVENDDDLIGLVAYGMFKGSIRQDHMSGTRTGTSRDPSPSMVKNLRSAAERKLELLVQANIAENQAELQESGATEAVREAETRLGARIDARTSTRTAIVTNVVAWVITLGLTAVILILANFKDAAGAIADAVIRRPPAQSAPTAASIPTAPPTPR